MNKTIYNNGSEFEIALFELIKRFDNVKSCKVKRMLRGPKSLKFEVVYFDGEKELQKL